MVPKLKKSYFLLNRNRNSFFPFFADYAQHLRSFTFRGTLPAGVDRRLFREFSVSVERLNMAVFGASTFFLLFLESFLEEAPVQLETICIPLCLVAGLTLFFVGLRALLARDRNQLYYSLFYVLLFLTVSHSGMGFAGESSEGYLLYIAFSLSQALRVGRFPGLPVILFLLAHWFVFDATDFFGDALDKDLESALLRGGFTFAWAAAFALFLESVLYFATMRYLELLARRRKEDADLELASRVHESLFPDFTENEFMRLHVYRSPENHTGGDFYDILHMREGGLGFFFADVAGHGISSAMMSAALKALLASVPYRMRQNPEAMMDHLDTVLSDEYASHHASGVYMFLDFQHQLVRLANAGHPAVYYSPAGGPFEEIETQGAVLGYRIRQPIAREKLMPCKSGDRFLLYTDGLTEYRRKSGDDFDLSMDALLQNVQHQSTTELLPALLAAVRQRPDFARFRDDVMLALIEIK